MSDAAKVQPLPVTTAESKDVLDDLIGCLSFAGQLVLSDRLIAELKERRELGIRKYGIGLQSHNMRDVKLDIRQELLDTVMYAHQGVMQGECVAHIRNRAIELLHELEQLETAHW